MLEMLMDEHHRLKQEADKEAEAERLAYEERGEICLKRDKKQKIFRTKSKRS